MSSKPLRLLILGAHPDDAEFHAGGLATIYRQHNHVVKMISVTDGRSGHHRYEPEQVARVRMVEGREAAAVIGAQYEAWEYPDGTLEPTLEVRGRMIREIRSFNPDLVLTHRPNDYHPDHRAVGQAVQDSSYMVTVPLVAPDVPILPRDPVIAYMPDLFTRPYPMVGDVVIDITNLLDTIVEMLACHKSQVFEFLPFNQGIAGQVPDDERQRYSWLRQWYSEVIRPRADRFREALIRGYGERVGRQIECVEAFEISEYASPLDEVARERLFWFLAKPEFLTTNGSGSVPTER